MGEANPLIELTLKIKVDLHTWMPEKFMERIHDLLSSSCPVDRYPFAVELLKHALKLIIERAFRAATGTQPAHRPYLYDGIACSSRIISASEEVISNGPRTT